MPEEQGKRPKSVTIIAWVWIITGVLMAMSGVMALLAYSMLKKMGGGQPLPLEMPTGVESMMFLLKHLGLLVFLQLAVSFITLVAGIAFLRLRAWARTAIEAITWLSLVYVVGFGFYSVYSWTRISGNIHMGAAPVDTGAFTIVGLLIAVLLIAVFAVPLIMMIRSLRGQEIRGAVAQASELSRER
jgi:hypothetical protein